MKFALYVMLELIVFTALISTIAFLSGQAREMQSSEIQKQDLRTELSNKRELYFYDNKVLTGNDVLVAVRKYTKVYNMRIQLGATGGTNWYNAPEGLSVDSDDSVWEIDRIRDQLSIYGNLNHKYRSTLEREDSGYVSTLVFTRED